jgi:hypothetical protein
MCHHISNAVYTRQPWAGKWYRLESAITNQIIKITLKFELQIYTQLLFYALVAFLIKVLISQKRLHQKYSRQKQRVSVREHSQP